MKERPESSQELPMLAPCRPLPATAPLRWLSPGWRELALFLGIGSAVGALFCLVIFTASAFSLPMLMERRVDAVTAIITSANAVLRNKPAMAVWATIIVSGVLAGILTAWLAFFVVLPVIGHATWHAYRETIDAGLWSRVRSSEA
ncbi:MAG: DUF2189 domain-containing protein [Wenzhouxiangella sp.]